MVQNTLFKSLTLIASFFCLVASAACFAFHAWMFGLGLWVSTAWIFLNSYFLFRLVQIGFEPKARMNDKILLFSILKFPVLYVAGFFILRTRVFPIYSILAGLTLFMFAFVIAWARFNFSPKGLEQARS